MADQAVAEEGAGTEAEAQAEAPKSGGKKLVLLIALPVLLLIGGGAGAFFAGLLDPLLGKSEEQAAAEAATAAAGGPQERTAVFFDLPDMLVNLNTAGRKTSYLKISVSLELEDAAGQDQIQQILPRIVDSFQVYLRELRGEDLSGSAGLQRLREELLLRVNQAAHPTVVSDVLFKEMLVQ